MAFCANCGTDVKDAKFCPSCGTQVAAAAQPAPAAEPAPQMSASQPRTVTVGQVKKCPSCGAPVESFQGRCSSCGHELGVSTVSAAIKEFSAQINSFDEKIAEERKQIDMPVSAKAAKTPVKGLASGAGSSLKSGVAGAVIGSALSSSGSRTSSSSRTGTAKKAVGGVVAVGIFAGMIALIVKAFKNFKNAVSRPAMCPTEKVKKSYIENFVVPNNREDILEFVLFASSKAEGVIDLSHKETMGVLANAHFWAKVWENKCRQVEDRAAITLAGDSATMSQVKKFYDRTRDTCLNITKAKKGAQVKSVIAFIFTLIIILGIAAVLGYLVLIFLLT